MRFLKNVLVAALPLVLVMACSGPAVPTVSRVSTNEEVDLSGYWNDTDSRLVSEQMIKELLTRPWMDEFRTAKGDKPTVVVGKVQNKTTEHIPTETFVKDLERELVNSGEVRFVASQSQRGSLGEEKTYQAASASLETQKAMGKELGADFILLGQLNAIEDRAGGVVLKYYQVELELINIESGEKVWMGQKKIKKVVERDAWN